MIGCQRADFLFDARPASPQKLTDWNFIFSRPAVAGFFGVGKAVEDLV
jgi:hypothetical protein